MFSFTYEFMRTPFGGFRFFWAFLAITALLTLFFIRKLDLTEFVLLAVFAVVAVRFTRGTAIFALVAVPALGRYYGLISKGLKSPGATKFLRSGMLILLFVVLGFSTYYKETCSTVKGQEDTWPTVSTLNGRFSCMVFQQSSTMSLRIS
jgi:hypothetical protein